MAWSSDELKAEYEQKAPLYSALCSELKTQIGELLKQASVSLAVPIEARVKTLESILNKCEQTGLEPDGLGEIGDIAGLRLVVLFRRDLEQTREILRANFNINREEDTADRLAEDQFGYGSVHFDVTPPKEWLNLPTLRKLEGLTAEIQLRTGSQHIWAAASHVLQYKKASHVPAPVMRSINRAAALLETVDLEFERVLAERDQYAEAMTEPQAVAVLDTDLLRSILDEQLPAENREPDEDYAELLDDLNHFKVETVGALKDLIEKHREGIAQADKRLVEMVLDKGTDHAGSSGAISRAEKGAYFTHVGLTREAISLEHGAAALRQQFAKRRESSGPA